MDRGRGGSFFYAVQKGSRIRIAGIPAPTSLGNYRLQGHPNLNSHTIHRVRTRTRTRPARRVSRSRIVGRPRYQPGVRVAQRRLIEEQDHRCRCHNKHAPARMRRAPARALSLSLTRARAHTHTHTHTHTQILPPKAGADSVRRGGARDSAPRGRGYGPEASSIHHRTRGHAWWWWWWWWRRRWWGGK